MWDRHVICGFRSSILASKIVYPLLAPAWAYVAQEGGEYSLPSLYNRAALKYQKCKLNKNSQTKYLPATSNPSRTLKLRLSGIYNRTSGYTSPSLRN